jgi:hypothetical protein
MMQWRKSRGDPRGVPCAGAKAPGSPARVIGSGVAMGALLLAEKDGFMSSTCTILGRQTSLELVISWDALETAYLVRRATWAASSTLEETPSLAKMCARCVATV